MGAVTHASLDALLEGVEGWLHPDEVALLHSLAGECTGRGAIVEIGSWKGRSTITLAAGATEGTRIYAIDPHTGSPEHHEEFGEVDTFAEFRANLERAGLYDRITPLVERSTDAAAHVDEPVELLFIDGEHSYESVRADIEAWFPKLVEGGVIALHDAFVYQGGPRVAIRRHLMGRVSDVGFAYSIFHARKRERPTPAQRVRAWAALVERNLRERYHLRGRFKTG